MTNLQSFDNDLWAFGNVVGLYKTQCTEFEIECAINASKILTEEHLVWHYSGGKVMVKCRKGMKNKVQETVDMMIKLKEEYTPQPESADPDEKGQK